MSLIQFFSFDALDKYVKAVTGEPIYGDQVSYDLWHEQYSAWMRDVSEGGRVKCIPKADGSFDYWLETGESDTIITNVGKMVETTSTGSTASTASSATQAVGGGGVKSAPTVSTVITDTATGDTVVTDSAKGFKNIGIDAPNSLGNIINGVSTAVGLVSLGLTLQNCKDWRDLLNHVFGFDLPEDATVDQVKDALSIKYHTIIGSNFDDSRDATTYVPEHIITRMYDYIAPHMEEDGSIEGLFTDYSPFDYMMFQGFIRENATSPRFYFDVDTGHQNAPLTAYHTYFDENMLHNWILDTLESLVAYGFNVTDEVTNELLSLTNGVTDWITQNIGAQAVVARVFNCYIGYNRSPHTALSVPVTSDEFSFSFEIDMADDVVIDLDSKGIQVQFVEQPLSPYIETAKNLKRGKTGKSANDFGYYTRTYVNTATHVKHTFNLQIREHEAIFNGPFTGEASGHIAVNMNGFCTDATPVNEYLNHYLPTGFSTTFAYSNMGYLGERRNYKPDSTLSKIFVKDDKNSLRPDPNTPANKRYYSWLGIDTKLKVGQITKNKQNTVTPYRPVNTPYGSKALDTSLANGYGTSSLNRDNPNFNPNGYPDPNDQNDNQIGKIPTDINMDDVNEVIKDAVDDFDESRNDPEHTPDPIPEPIPVPTYPVNPPIEPGPDTPEEPDPTVLPSVTASGMCSVYNPTKQELINFSAWLWSPNFFDNFMKLFSNPMDAIIGLHLMYATPSTTTPSNIIVGYLDSGVSSKVVNKQFITVECGTVFIPEFYGNATDYEPYTMIHVYLPFIGIQSLKANDVVGKQLKIKYGVDVMTGTCLAMLFTIQDGTEILCYTFPGNCTTQVPLSGGTYANVIRSIASMAVGVAGSVITKSPLPAIGGAISGAMSASVDVARSGSIGANAGAMGVRKPYVIITRRVAYNAGNYNKFYGYPANKTVTLGICRGFTRVKDLHIDSIARATDNEKTEIETLLKQGVIIK